MISIATTNDSSFHSSRPGLVCPSGDVESQRSSMKHRRRKLRFECAWCENRLAALYTEIDRLDERLDRIDVQSRAPD